MTPDTWTNPDYHWQPPAGQLYTYDPAKANQLLDAAGYKLVNGVRLEKNGKPVTLRLWASSETPEEQTMASLIVGYFRALGIKINYQVMDEGVFYQRIWNYAGSTFKPDFDMYVWDWDGYIDPGDTLASFTTSQIESWNEMAWSYPPYDKVVAEQSAVLDPQQRAPLVWKAQQLFYEQSPIGIGAGLLGQDRSDQRLALAGPGADQPRRRPGVLHHVQPGQLSRPQARCGHEHIFDRQERRDRRCGGGHRGGRAGRRVRTAAPPAFSRRGVDSSPDRGIHRRPRTG